MRYDTDVAGSASIFRSFLPPLNALGNPLGFGVADYVELLLAMLLVGLYFARPVIEPYFRRLAERTSLCMVVLAVLPVALRLALLPHFPVPTPTGSDDFSHLLRGRYHLAHFRLANPTHLFHQFFEAIYVMQEPTYSSMYPPGQGLVLAIGRLLFGTPWAGVVLTVAAFCSLCYWMLRGWTTPVWALAGGLLAVFQFGPDESVDEYLLGERYSRNRRLPGIRCRGPGVRWGKRGVRSRDAGRCWVPGLALHLIIIGLLKRSCSRRRCWSLFRCFRDATSCGRRPPRCWCCFPRLACCFCRTKLSAGSGPRFLIC